MNLFAGFIDVNHIDDINLCFILIRFIVNPELMLLILGMRWEYTKDETPVQYRAHNMRTYIK